MAILLSSSVFLMGSLVLDLLWDLSLGAGSLLWRFVDLNIVVGLRPLVVSLGVSWDVEWSILVVTSYHWCG